MLICLPAAIECLNIENHEPYILCVCVFFSSYEGHAVHLWDVREVVQAQHVPEGSLSAALWGETLQVWGLSSFNTLLFPLNIHQFKTCNRQK